MKMKMRIKQRKTKSTVYKLDKLADILSRLANTLNANQTPGPNTNSRGTKACITNTFSGTKPNKLNNFLFQYYLYFCANLAQFNMNIVKINKFPNDLSYWNSLELV